MFRYIIRCEKLFKNLSFKRRITTTIIKLNESKKTDKKYGQTSSVQKILKIKDLVDYLVYGTFGVALYYAYQRYKKWNEIKQELKADLTEIKEFKIYARIVLNRNPTPDINSSVEIKLKNRLKKHNGKDSGDLIKYKSKVLEESI